MKTNRKPGINGLRNELFRDENYRNIKKKTMHKKQLCRVNVEI